LTLATGAALLQALVVFELHVFSILHRVAMMEKTSLDVDLDVRGRPWMLAQDIVGPDSKLVEGERNIQD
jgi:hypothetical protein